MARISKFVKIREVLHGEISKIVKKEMSAVADENYAMAALYKGFRDTLNLLSEIIKEKEAGGKNE